MPSTSKINIVFINVTISVVIFLVNEIYIYMEFRKMVMITLYAKQKKRQRCIEQTFGRKARVGCFERTASKHVYYLG